MSSDLIKKLFQAIDARDWDALKHIFHPDAVYERPGYEPFVGIDRLLQFYRDERVISSGKHHIEHIVMEGDYGACWGRFVGVKKDNTEADEQFVDVYSFEQGMIKTRRSYFFRPAI